MSCIWTQKGTQNHLDDSYSCPPLIIISCYEYDFRLKHFSISRSPYRTYNLVYTLHVLTLLAIIQILWCTMIVYARGALSCRKPYNMDTKQTMHVGRSRPISFNQFCTVRMAAKVQCRVAILILVCNQSYLLRRFASWLWGKPCASIYNYSLLKHNRTRETLGSVHINLTVQVIYI